MSTTLDYKCQYLYMVFKINIYYIKKKKNNTSLLLFFSDSITIIIITILCIYGIDILGGYGVFSGRGIIYFQWYINSSIVIIVGISISFIAFL